MEMEEERKKKKNLKARIYKLFKSSNCTMKTKSIPKSVENSVHFSPSCHYHHSDDTNTLFNLHRSLSLPYFAENQLNHVIPTFQSSSHKKHKAPAEFQVFWDGTAGDHKDKKRRNKNKNKNKKRLLCSNPYGFTSSSSSSDLDDEGNDDDDDDGLFSSDEFETGTPFSSRHLSSDSSEFYYNSSLSGKKKIAPMRRRRRSRRRLPPRPPRRDGSGNRDRSHDGLLGFRPLVSVPSRKVSTTTTTNNKKKKKRSRKVKKVAAEVVEEEDSRCGDGNGTGVPVVKESNDPYADFSISMLEMIVEKQMFGKDKLESLLQCYLSLNPSHHHPIILKVFSDICKVLFSN